MGTIDKLIALRGLVGSFVLGKGGGEGSTDSFYLLY